MKSKTRDRLSRPPNHFNALIQNRTPKVECMNLLCILPLILLMTNCCKVELPEHNSVIGHWQAYSIDSVRVVPPFYDSHTILGSLNPEGFMDFSSDSTGLMYFECESVTHGDSIHYSFNHNKIQNELYFIDDYGKITEAYISKLKADTLMLQFRGLDPAGTGAIKMYYINLHKAE